MARWQSPCCEGEISVYDRHYIILRIMQLRSIHSLNLVLNISVAFLPSQLSCFHVCHDLNLNRVFTRYGNWLAEALNDPDSGSWCLHSWVKHTLPCISCSPALATGFSSRQAWTNSMNRPYRLRHAQLGVSSTLPTPHGSIPGLHGPASTHPHGAARFHGWGWPWWSGVLLLAGAVRWAIAALLRRPGAPHTTGSCGLLLHPADSFHAISNSHQLGFSYKLWNTT